MMAVIEEVLDMWGYLGLTTAYILIASILLWLFINSRTNIVIKTLIVPVVLWYGIVLYYTPSNLMGWPTAIASIEQLPADSFVLGISIKEPSKKTNDPGAIFITLLQSTDNESNFSLNPKDAFTYHGKAEPRTYKVPYSRELHKKIIDAQKAQRGQQGSTIKTKKKADKTKKKQEGTIGDETSKSKELFRIINPIELMPKEQQ